MTGWQLFWFSWAVLVAVLAVFVAVEAVAFVRFCRGLRLTERDMRRLAASVDADREEHPEWLRRP